ncbi:MAG TPA: M20/M25/M40 family metallo-hydrolase [Candidatus Limnocylindria bacterium]|nr:M20/M25/M40 family metallo-hydrolase [Candidatus Limnocylindria bacterium]
MSDPLEPARVRALAEALIAVPSVSPDPEGERACAERIRAALPADIEHGTWTTPDGRPIIWAFLRGDSYRTVVLLGHVDTVGVAEYGALGDEHGVGVAFRPEALRRRLLEHDCSLNSDAALRALSDLEEERRAPGTWMFGRGALDMKSGIAAGLAALAALARAPERQGSVLFVACPDEEHESAGMRVAVGELLRMRDERSLRLLGVLNLDFGSQPAAYAGVVGKLLIGLWVLGEPTHVSEPFRGADPARLAAAIVTRATLADELVERWGELEGAPPVVLRLRDLKEAYNVQTAREAVIELNAMTMARPLATTLEAVRGVVVEALRDFVRTRHARSPSGEGDGRRFGSRGDDGARAALDTQVLLYPDLLRRAGRDPSHDPLADVDGDPAAASLGAREKTLDRVRRLAAEARLSGPAVVIYLLPPYYPHAAPGEGPLCIAARRALAREDIPVLPFYPHISDASYVAWRGEPAAQVAEHLPALGREYELPWAAAAALDLDVVNLGPWGRDAHGLFERVHAPYAFARLPRLIVETVLETWR